MGLLWAEQLLVISQMTDWLGLYVGLGFGQSMAMADLIWTVAAIRRRRHFRSWRIHVETVPVLPGETIAFEISREDGLPLGAGLRLELVGSTFYWSWNPLKNWKAMYRQPVPGDVQADVAAAGQAASIKGTLRIDAAGLVLAPPPGVKDPGRLFAFLRVRQSWWTRCLFEVPLPAVYFAAPAAKVRTSP
jgi:hypothetical protein